MICACGCGSPIVSLGAARYIDGRWYYRAHYNAMMVERQEAHANESIEQYRRDKKRIEIEGIDQ